MANGNLVRQSNVGKDSVVFGPTVYDVPLLPYEKQLIQTIGITEEEYRKFAAEVRRRGRLRPAEYEHIPNVQATGVAETVLINLAISLVLTGVSYLLTPKPKMPSAARKGGVVDIEGFTGPTRFTPSRGFETLADIADYASPIPIVFGLYDSSDKVGGMLVTPKMVWSRMFSHGVHQQAKMLFVVGEQGLINEDGPSGIVEPDLEGIFLGNNALDQIFENQFAFYFRRNTDRHKRIIGSDFQYGTKGKISTGDPDGPRGNEEVFLCPTRAADADVAFCHAFSPANATEFGLYEPIANGTSYRLNYQAMTVFKHKEGEKNKFANKDTIKTQIAERVKVIGDQNHARDNLPDKTKYRSAEFLKEVMDDKEKFAEGKGRNYSPRMGIFKVTRNPGAADEEEIKTDSNQLKKRVKVAKGDTATFLISHTTIPEKLYQNGGRGPSTQDINDSVRAMQFAADKAMQLGEVFSIGGTVWTVTKRKFARYDPDTINVDETPNVDDRDQLITLECIDTSKCFGPPEIGIVNEKLVIKPGDSRRHYIDDILNVGEEFFPITKYSVASVRNNRPAAITEIGIKSTVFQNLKGICAFSGTPGPTELKELGNDGQRINNGVFTGSILRSSVFRLYLRKAGQDEDKKGFDFAPFPTLFVIRGSKPVAQYNSLRIRLPGNTDQQELEFNFVPVSAAEFRFLDDTATIFSEISNNFDDNDAAVKRIDQANVPDLGQVTVEYKGKTIPRSAIVTNSEFYRGEKELLSYVEAKKPSDIGVEERLPDLEYGTRVQTIERVRNIGNLETNFGKNGAFSHAIAGEADENDPRYFKTTTREFFDNNRWIVINWTFEKIKLSKDHYARSQNNAKYAWVPRTADVAGSSRGFAVGDVVTIKRGLGGTNVYGGDPSEYPDDNPFKNNNPSGTLTFSGRDVRITEASENIGLGGRTQGYLYELFGSAENLAEDTLSAKQSRTFTKVVGEVEKSIRVNFQSQVRSLANSFSGQAKGWTFPPSIEVVQDSSDTSDNWKIGDTFTHEVTPGNPANNPFHNKYGKVGIVYRIEKLDEIVVPGKLQKGVFFSTNSQVADISVYRELVEKSNSSAPEHEIVYVNEILENELEEDRDPNFSNLTQAGLSLKASRNFTQLDQLRLWIAKGTQVKRLHPELEKCYGDSKEIGPSNLFTDLVYYLLTDQVAGAGGLLGMKTNDAPLVDLDQMIETTRFIKKEKLYFNGPITDRTNLRQFITDLAPNFLCNFIVSDGKFALKPAIPYNPKSGAINLGPVQVEQLFTSGNILEDTFKVEYLRSEERRQFKAVVRYRHEQPNKLPEERSVEVVLKGEISGDRTVDLLPQEQFDLTQFCTSEDHAVKVAKYFIALRKLVTHTISFSTTLEGLSIAAGSYIKVVTEASPYSPANNGTISSSGVVTSVEDLADGQYQVSYFQAGSEDVEDGTMTVSNGRVQESKFHDSVFSLKNDTVSRNVYVVEQLTFSEQGTVDIVASEHPCDNEDRSELASLVTSDSFRIF